ncbi:hypothetical protein BDZ94DRAFT_1277580, partial [Collybia nuda]
MSSGGKRERVEWGLARSDFKSRQGLSSHRTKCKNVLPAATAMLEKRRQRLLRQEQERKKKDKGKSKEDLADYEMGGPETDEGDQMGAMGLAIVADKVIFKPQPTASGRIRKFPKQYTDFLPSSATPVPHMPDRPPRIIAQKPAAAPSPSPPPETPEAAPTTIETEPNEFGLYRVYMTFPTNDPDETLDLDDVCDAPGLAVSQDSSACRTWWSGFGSEVQDTKEKYFAPFLNTTVFRLMNWFYNGSNMKSLAELDSLVQGVLLAEDFDKKHLEGFSAARELGRLNKYMDNPGLHPEDGWKESTVRLRLPAEKVRHRSEHDAPEFEVTGVYHRNIISVVKSAFQEPIANTFHFSPFRLFWKPSPDEPPQRVISELYNSDALLAEHEKIQKQPRESGCTLETAVAAIMLWSDSTHLA